MVFELENKRVLITGASRGIGAALAKAFAAEGCVLRLIARSEQELTALANSLRIKYSVEIEILAIDMTSTDAIKIISDFAFDTDVLINNAGAIPGGNLWDVDESTWRIGWELKVFGYINLIRAIYPCMRKRGGGVILNNIGNGGENFDFDYIAGTTGNAALMAFTRALGGKSMDDGIRVVGVNAGPVSTERIYRVLQMRATREFGDASKVTEFTKKLPLGRPATVEEVADLFVFLASIRSQYISGTIVTIDGGLTSKRQII